MPLEAENGEQGKRADCAEHERPRWCRSPTSSSGRPRRGSVGRRSARRGGRSRSPRVAAAGCRSELESAIQRPTSGTASRPARRRGSTTCVDGGAHGRRQPLDVEVQLEHVDGVLAEPERRTARCGGRRRRARDRAAGLARATRGAWRRALATEIPGSRPDADEVTASAGTGASASRPLISRYAAARRATSSTSAGFVGPRFAVPLAEPSYPPADGRGWKNRRSTNA